MSTEEVPSSAKGTGFVPTRKFDLRDLKYDTLTSYQN